MTSVTEMPYFEGDFWPNILEESIKEVEQEELEKRRREEEEAAADTDDGEPSANGDRVEVGDVRKYLLVLMQSENKYYIIVKICHILILHVAPFYRPPHLSGIMHWLLSTVLKKQAVPKSSFHIGI